MFKNFRVSRREKQVINFLIEGYKSKIIAKELGISEKTVGSYIARIRQKFGVSSDANTYKLVNTIVGTAFHENLSQLNQENDSN